VILLFDASVLVAALVHSGPDGAWAAAVLGDRELAAPHLMPIEAADILRRAALAGDITADSASLAQATSSICASSCGRMRPSPSVAGSCPRT
jgi:predicted nucleic acid-binding protein